MEDNFPATSFHFPFFSVFFCVHCGSRGFDFPLMEVPIDDIVTAEAASARVVPR
jgi:hypothetical protein